MKLPWYLRQEPTVTLIAGLGGLFTVVNLASAQPWAATTAPRLSWKALAASADGFKLVAAANSGTGYGASPAAPLYISTNAGAAWIQTDTPSNYWASVASSADGTKLVGAATLLDRQRWEESPWDLSAGDGLIYTSPDMGKTWMPTSAPSNYWASVASSADGARLVAVAAPVAVYDTNGNWPLLGEGAIYRSLDSGTTWMRTSAPSNYWTSVASSADATRLVAVAAPVAVYDTNGDWSSLGEGAIYHSLDSGTTWMRTSAPSNHWTCVASSADGAKLVAVSTTPWWDSTGPDYVGEGAIYRSLDSGASWSRTSAPSNFWSCVASSADGTKLAAAANVGPIYTSSDSGATWRPTGAPLGAWTSLVSSADGYRVVAGGEGPSWDTPLCTLPYSGPWRLAEAPPNEWSAVVSSADGTKLVAVASTGPYSTPFSAGDGSIYTSTNSGMTWTPASAPSKNWTSVASSADGARLVAAAAPYEAAIEGGIGWAGDGPIYRSLDSGATWSQTGAPSEHWASVAASADGARLVAVAAPQWTGGHPDGDGVIYGSLDSGATWSRTSAPSNYWSSVACSADGTRVVAASADIGLIYTSSDSAATWTQTSAPTNYWSCVGSSADGTKLVAAVAWGGPDSTNGIYTSSDSGATWRTTGAPSNNWLSVASSADGTKLAAVAVDRFPGTDPSRIYTSTDSGATWKPAGEPAASWIGSFHGVALSADGSNIVVLADQFIWTLRSPAPAPPLPPSPQLAVVLSGATVGLSWLVPSTRFVLQQSADLRPANWVDVPASPTLDFTDLHYRVTLTPSLGRAYYRLKQQ